MRTIAFDLLIGGDGAKDDFRKLAVGERSVSDPTNSSKHKYEDDDNGLNIPNNFQRMFDNSNRKMRPVVD